MKMTNIKIKNNAINIIILIGATNYYFIHALGKKTYSMGAFEDNGWGSILCIAFIMTAGLTALYNAFKSDKLINFFDWCCLAYICEIYALREADFHNTFTKHNVTKSKFFFNPEESLISKWVVGILFTLFFASLIYLCIKYTKILFKKWFKCEPWAISLSLWFILIVSSVIIDKMKIPYDTPITRNIEEMIEITAALYAATSALIFTFFTIKNNEKIN